MLLHSPASTRGGTNARTRVNHSWSTCSTKSPINLKDKGLTKFAQAMPDEYKNESATEAYRAYYKGEKSRIAKWTNADVPEWWTA